MLFVVFLTLGYFQKLKQPAVAEAFGGLVCDAIIPIGEVPEDIKGLMDIVYQNYQANVEDVKAAVGSLTEIVALLTENPEVCHFDRCYPEVVDTGPDFALKFNALVKSGEIVGAHLPICTPKAALGQPCPVIDELAITHFKELEGSLRASAKEIEELFSEKTELVTEETAQEGETPYVTKLTRLEAVQRNIDLVDRWLNPSSVINCALSERERDLIKAGKLPEMLKEPMRCKDALEQGLYKRPTPWSEKCQDECGAGLSDDCVKCLAKCEGISAIAKLNCKMYSDQSEQCGNVCKKGFSPDCTNCLCEGLSDKECTTLLCGSANNWLCCHALPLEKQ